MRLRDLRKLLELTFALVCLWAAAYHTPAGALARRGWAWATHQKSSAPSLLAFYGGTEPEVADTWAQAPAPLLPPETGSSLPPGAPPLSERLALGYGVHAGLMALDAAARAPAREVAQRHGLSPSALEDATQGPHEAARLLETLAADFPSEDAAVVALLCGETPARYAQQRARAEGKRAELDALARALPPKFEAQVRQAKQALTLGTAYGLAWPVADSTRITSPFGERNHPLLGGVHLHTGVDLSVPEGTLVHATGAGTVRRASEDEVNGKVLILDHGHGVATAYCHNSELQVAGGEAVTRGQGISLSGNTGRSTGPHLHYQVMLAGRPVDPLRFRRVPLTADRGGGEP